MNRWMHLPFTLFHIGPASLGLLAREYLHMPTFLAANLLVDVEPLSVLLLGAAYPLHGYLHTFLLASLFGSLLGAIMFLSDPRLHGLFTSLRLVPETQKFGSFLAAGVLGGIIHVLLDAPLYAEMNPFFPLLGNSLYNPSFYSLIIDFCILTGFIGAVLYFQILFADRK